MANNNTSGGKQGLGKPNEAGIESTTAQPASTPRKGHQHRGSKGSRPAVGGTAVPGAKSTQVRQISESSNPQQQQYESYNRDMRRRMEHMGYEDETGRAQTAQDQRKKRIERLKQRRQQQLAHVKRTLPGGKLDTSPRRVYWMIAGVAILVIAIIVIFAILRSTGH